MLTVRADRNVTIEGQPGATIRMWKKDYLNRSEYQKAQWRMGIYLGRETRDPPGSNGSATEAAFRSCRDMAVRGLRIEDSGGDGIIVNCCTNVHIARVVSNGNLRQGLSVIGARHLLVEHSEFSNTNGTAPSAYNSDTFSICVLSVSLTQKAS